MYDAFEAARAAGTNIAFFGANNVYWQVRLETSAIGGGNRTIVSYKDPVLDPVAQSELKTDLFRNIGRPEQSLLGVMYDTFNDYSPDGDFNTDLIVLNSNNSLYEGSGLTDGASIAKIVGYEIDRRFDEFPSPEGSNYTLLSASPFLSINGDTVVANSSIYQAPSGAWVFSSGTMSWSWALEKPGFVNEGIRRVTTNLMNRFLGTAAPPPVVPPPPIDPVDPPPPVGNDAELLNPPANSVVRSGQEFTWSDVGADEYWLDVGDFFGAGQGSNTSGTVDYIPANGETFNVRLWTIRNDDWTFTDRQYIAESDDDTSPPPVEPPQPPPGSSSCVIYASYDVPKAISAEGTPRVVSSLDVKDHGTVVDVNVIDLSGQHDFFSDLHFTLASPLGTSVGIMDNSCPGYAAHYYLSLDDEAPVSWDCLPDDGGYYIPDGPLGTFIGEQANGEWQLIVNDIGHFDGGSLKSWALEVCFD